MVGVTKIQRGNASYWLERGRRRRRRLLHQARRGPGRVGRRAGRRARPAGRGRPRGLRRDPRGQGPRRRRGRSSRRPAPRKSSPTPRRQRAPAEPVLGYDVRFAAPKSVSLLYALGSRRFAPASWRAYDEAVARASPTLKREACFVQRGSGGKPDRARRGLRRDGLPPPHQPRRRPRPSHPRPRLQHDPGRQRRALAQPRLAEGPLAALDRTASRPAYVFQAALRAGSAREFGLDWRAGPTRLRRHPAASRAR